MIKHAFHPFLLLPLLLLLSCSSEPQQRPRSGDEELNNPEAVLVDEEGLQKALEFLRSKSFADGIEEVVILKDGKLIYEGDSTRKAHNIYSCSKAFTSTILGLLIQDGVVQLDEVCANYEPVLLEQYSTVTFRHFATMTSGYSAVGRSRWNDENSDWSWTPYDPDVPHFAPGTHYEYWDEAQMMYGRVLTNILERPLKDFLTERITDPIGLGEWSWGTEQETAKGIPINNGCTGVKVNAQQLARIGQLYLNVGNWKGQQLLDSTWCKMALQNQVPAEIPVFPGDRASARGSGSYGFNWWVNSPDGLSRMPDVPLDVAYMSGLNHNVCALIPSWNMVVVRMGDDKNPPEGKYVVWNDFLKLLGEALREG